MLHVGSKWKIVLPLPGKCQVVMHNIMPSMSAKLLRVCIRTAWQSDDLLQPRNLPEGPCNLHNLYSCATMISIKALPISYALKACGVNSLARPFHQS